MNKSHSIFMNNPFSLHWNRNWTFQLVHMEGGIYLEAKGLGISIRKSFLLTENLLDAADNLVNNEDKNRQSLFNSWNARNLIGF